MRIEEVSEVEQICFTHIRWPSGTMAYREGDAVIWRDTKSSALIKMPLEILAELEEEKDGFSFCMFDVPGEERVLN
jgi:hypothetical protein